MSKKITIGMSVAMMFIAATITFTVTMIFSMKYFDALVLNVKERESMYTKISEVDNKVRQNILLDIDEEELNNMTIEGYIAGTGDIYAQYYTAQEYKTLLDSNKGEVVGVGIEITKDPSGYMKVTGVQEGSSSFEEGLLVGDVIKKIEGKDILEVGYGEAVNMLKGEPNSKVTITIQSGLETKDVLLTRRQITIISVTGEVKDDIGYVRIKEFNDKTPAQFINKVEELKGLGVKGFVFDVRNNPGGSLQSVSEIIDYIVPEGDIVSAEYKNGEKEVLFTSNPNELDMPMVVITNGQTASAAELFASALKDYNKALTVGTTTYGKGIMQETFNLSDGSAVRMTTAEYLPPKSENYNGIGVKADFEVKITPEQETSVYVDGLDNDLQYIKAYEILKSDANAE